MAAKVTVEDLQRRFTEFVDSSDSARKLAERSRDYYDSKQLTQQELDVFRRRKQPALINNRIQPLVDFLLGMERKTRTDPKAWPRTPEHDQAAEAATDGIRFVVDNNDFDITASDVFENILIEGAGGASVEVEERGKELWITVTRFPYDRFAHDPHSTDRQFRDASWTAVIIWMNLNDAKIKWPKKAKEIENRTNAITPGNTYDDKPRLWFDSQTQRAMLVDMYHNDNGWKHSIFMDGVFLEETKASAFVDEFGKPENPHIAVSNKVDRDNNRYGLVSTKLDIQDDINKRHSKSSHILSTKQTWSKQGQLDDVEEFKREMNKPDGHVEFPNMGEFGKDFGVIDNQSLVAPQVKMYELALRQMESSANGGISDVQDSQLSGRAINRIQQGKSLEVVPTFDAHAQWKKRVYRAIWSRIRQFWTEERWIRVTDDANTLRFVGLNKPRTVRDELIAQGQQISPEIANDPRLDEPVRDDAGKPIIDNDVAEIDVDIVIEEVPDLVNVQLEQFDILSKLFPSAPPEMQEKLWEMLVRMSTIREKDKLLGNNLDPQEQQRMREAQQIQQQEQQENRQLTIADLMAGIEQKKAKALKDQQSAQQTSIETQILATNPDQKPQVSI